MIQENEVIMFTLGLGIFFFILANRYRLRRIPNYKLLLTAYVIVLTAWILTVAEGFFFGHILNFFEHACYAASGLTLVVWCWKISRQKQKETP